MATQYNDELCLSGGSVYPCIRGSVDDQHNTPYKPFPFAPNMQLPLSVPPFLPQFYGFPKEVMKCSEQQHGSVPSCSYVAPRTYPAPMYSTTLLEMFQLVSLRSPPWVQTQIPEPVPCFPGAEVGPYSQNPTLTETGNVFDASYEVSSFGSASETEICNWDDFNPPCGPRKYPSADDILAITYEMIQKDKAGGSIDFRSLVTKFHAWTDHNFMQRVSPNQLRKVLEASEYFEFVVDANRTKIVLKGNAWKMADQWHRLNNKTMKEEAHKYVTSPKSLQDFMRYFNAQEAGNVDGEGLPLQLQASDMENLRAMLEPCLQQHGQAFTPEGWIIPTTNNRDVLFDNGFAGGCNNAGVAAGCGQ